VAVNVLSCYFAGGMPKTETSPIPSPIANHFISGEKAGVFPPRHLLGQPGYKNELPDYPLTGLLNTHIYDNIYT
jgi:hypothetical protein